MEKERRTKALVLSALVIVVATVSIAFAAMSQVLNINGIGKMDTASWSVYFDNLSSAKTTRGAQEVGKPKISDDKGTVQDINVKLSNPKDEISYTVDIVNDGTIDAEITMIKDIELTDVQKKVFEFKVTYTDTGEVLQNGDILPKDTTKNITINIKFRDDITEFDLPTEQQIINLSYQITYTQYDGSEIVVEPDGEEEKLKPESTVMNAFLTNSSIEAANVESIDFISELRAQDNAIETWDASEAGDNSVIGSYTDIDSNGLYEVYIGGTNGVYAPADCSGMFNIFCNNLTKEINFNGNFNTSNVTDMNCMFGPPFGLYYNEYALGVTTLDVSDWDTSNVTNMRCMFWNCQYLTSLDLSGWDTTNVTNMFQMFGFTPSLKEIKMFNKISTGLYSEEDYSGGVYEMFLNCGVEELDMSNVDVSECLDMSYMFIGAWNLKKLNLSGWDTSNVTNMSYMFTEYEGYSGTYSAPIIESLDLSNWNASKVTTMESMFNGCSSLTNLVLSNFNASNVTTMNRMFSGCTSLTSLDFLHLFDTSNVTDMSLMFGGCSSLTNLDLSFLNVSNVTNMSGMFYNCTSLESLDLSTLDTTKVTSMDKTGGVTLILGMFEDCTSLTQIKFNNAVFTNVSFYSDNGIAMFKNVPNNFTIYVKDETAKNFILGIRSDANVIIEPLSS